MSTSASATIEVATNLQYNSTSPSFITFSGTASSLNSEYTPSVNYCWFKSYTSGSAQNINVQSLTDAFGNSLSFATVSTIVIQITSTSGNLVVTGDLLPSSEQWTIKSNSSGECCFASQWNYTVGSGANTITLTPSTSMTFNVAIAGS